MTPQLEAAIAAIQLLSSTERLQLLQILTQIDSASNSQTDLKTLSREFWHGCTLKQLLATQTQPFITSRISPLTFGPKKTLLRTSSPSCDSSAKR
ncbi:hypothetical protein [Nostoc sp.]